MAMRDGVGGTSFDTVAAEDTAVVIDIVDLGVPVAAADTGFGGIFGGFYVNAIGGASGGAQEAGDAFFETVFVALQNMRASKAFLQLRRTVRVRLGDGRLEHLLERDPHAFGDCRGIADSFKKIGHDPLQVSASFGKRRIWGRSACLRTLMVKRCGSGAAVGALFASAA